MSINIKQIYKSLGIDDKSEVSLKKSWHYFIWTTEDKLKMLSVLICLLNNETDWFKIWITLNNELSESIVDWSVKIDVMIEDITSRAKLLYTNWLPHETLKSKTMTTSYSNCAR